MTLSTAAPSCSLWLRRLLQNLSLLTVACLMMPMAGQGQQSAPTLLGTNSIFVGSAGGSSSVVLFTSTTWTATANDSFLHVSAGSSSGTGSAVVIFTYDPFSSPGTRTGTLTIAGLTVSVTETGTGYVGPGTTTIPVALASGVDQGAIASDSFGDVYVAQRDKDTISEWNATTQQLTTLVPSGAGNSWGLAADNSGNLYFTDQETGSILEWSPVTQQTTTVVGLGAVAKAVAVDGFGNIYIANPPAYSIQEWNASTQQLTTLVSGLSYPTGVAVDVAGNVYIADTGVNAVYEWSPATQQLNTLTAPGVVYPAGIAVDGSGNVYIANPSIGAIQEWSAATQQLTTLITGIGVATEVAVDGSGNVYYSFASSEALGEIQNAWIGPASLTEPISAGSDSLFPVVPATASLTGVYAPTSDQDWLTIGSVESGVINFSFSADTSTNRTANISVLGQQLSVSQITGQLAAQTISFPAIAAQMSGTNFALSATASSGLSVSFNSQSTQVCTVAGNTATLLSPGTCIIQATQPGNSIYSAAAPVVQSFQVTLESQFITFPANKNPIYFGSIFNLNATASSRLPITYTSDTPSVCTINGSQAITLAAGTCRITASQPGNGFYAAANPVNQSFQIRAASQYIAFAATSNLVGYAPFTASAVASSGLAVSYASLTPAICGLSGATVTPLAMGICTIQATQAGNSNYQAAPAVNQSFEVGSQSIFFGAIPNQVLGSSPLQVSATVSSGLAASFASTTPSVCTVSGTTVTPTSLGICTIQATQAGNSSYSAATPLNQSFQITSQVTNAQLGTNSLVVGSGGGNSSVLLSTSGNWSAVSNSSFLHVSPASASGTGNAMIVFTVDPFPSAGTQTGTLTIAGLMLTVTQAGTNFVGPGPVVNLASSGLNLPQGLAVDNSGNVFIADEDNAAIEEWSPSSQKITTLASNLVTRSVATDNAGDVFNGDYSNSLIEEWNAATQQFTTVVSSGLNGPLGLAADSSGNLYIADLYSNSIEEWSAATQQVTTLVSGINSPVEVAVDALGNVYILTGSRSIVEWSAATQQVTGLPIPGLVQPTSIAVDGAGNLYILDGQNFAVPNGATYVYQWSPASQQLKTITTSTPEAFFAMTADNSGNVYIADNNCPQSTCTISEIPNAFVGPTNPTEPASAGSDSLQVLPASIPLNGVYAPVSDSSWLTIGTITSGVISYSFTANPSNTTRTAHITVLGQQVTVTQSGNGLTTPTVSFTGAPAMAPYLSTFTVAATTNASTTAVITASGSCSIAGFTVTISLSSGTCLLSATWAADSNYAAASATQSTVATMGTPSINWTQPVAITYGTTLTGTQLDATATYNGTSLAGTLTYTPAKGTVLTAGSQTLSVRFVPKDTTDYTSASASVTLQVNQAMPKISWAKPAAITYGTALSSTQLDATVSVPGTLVYSPAIGTVLTAGAQTLSVTFTPTDTTDYAMTTATVTITVSQASAGLTWTTPQPITYGTPLSIAQLNATASVPGSFAYTPAAGAIVGGGTDNLSVTFTPTDTTDYVTAKVTVVLQVNAATPTINWTTPAAITYGTALTSAQLNATATYNGASVPGTFGYVPAKGTVLTAGSQALTVTFTPNNSANYSTPAGATVSLQVNQATPKITWAKPAAITYGTALSSTQLDATASVPGTFQYLPAAGAILTAGSQSLTVEFTPTDTVDYAMASDTVAINVSEAASTTTINSSSPNPSEVNQPVTVSVTVSGVGVPTGNVTVTASSGQTCTATLAAGTGSCTLAFTAAGSPKLTAAYAGDGNFKSSTSAKLTQVVQ